MVVIRCTRKLLRHLEYEDAGDVPTSTTRLGDWFANLVIVRRQHLVLAVSGATLLPVLVPAAPYKAMIAVCVVPRAHGRRRVRGAHRSHSLRRRQPHRALPQAVRRRRP